jgi:hypothetical protein
MRVAFHLLAEVGEDLRLLGPRTHDVHVALQHVHHLRELVEAILPQHVADRGDPRVARARPDLQPPVVRVGHRPELVHREQPAAVVELPAALPVDVVLVPTVQTHARLAVDHGSRRRELDDQRDQEHQRRGRHENENGRHHVEDAPPVRDRPEGASRIGGSGDRRDSRETVLLGGGRLDCDTDFGCGIHGIHSTGGDCLLLAIGGRGARRWQGGLQCVCAGPSGGGRCR